MPSTTIPTLKTKNTKKSSTKIKNKILKIIISIFVIYIFTLFALFLIRHDLSNVRPKIVLKYLNLNDNNPKISNQLSNVDHGDRNLKKIALTFDADMTSYMLDELNSGKIKSFYNKEIVDILRQKNIPATIFITGLWAEKYPKVTKELFDDPLFEIANHSYSHPGFTSTCFGLPRIPVWGKDQEFVKSQEAIKKITGIYPKYFRFPGGCRNQSDIDLANKHGLTVVGWDAASNDSFNNNLDSIIHNVETKTQNGSIILFHFNGNKNAPLTAPALLTSIKYLQSKGYQFVKLSELLSVGSLK